jgi:hypothetical protein
VEPDELNSLIDVSWDFVQYGTGTKSQKTSTIDTAMKTSQTRVLDPMQLNSLFAVYNLRVSLQ